MLIPFNKVNFEKLSCSFTWDDNSLGHKEINDIFCEFGLRTTFYIVPGEANFASCYAGQYSKLSLAGHEIGSHTYTHPHMTSLGKTEAKEEFIRAINAITTLTGIYPSTFAFPHHDINDALLVLANGLHLKTRNDLNNTRRISLKTNTTITDIKEQLKELAVQNINVTFSGHSLASPLKFLDDSPGYEPITPQLLRETLTALTTDLTKFQVLTFEQTALKNYIKAEVQYDDSGCFLTETQLHFLKDVGLNISRLKMIL